MRNLTVTIYFDDRQSANFNLTFEFLRIFQSLEIERKREDGPKNNSKERPRSER